jgi:hypothetical protein
VLFHQRGKPLQINLINHFKIHFGFLRKKSDPIDFYLLFPQTKLKLNYFFL